MASLATLWQPVRAGDPQVGLYDHFTVLSPLPGQDRVNFDEGGTVKVRVDETWRINRSAGL